MDFLRGLESEFFLVLFVYLGVIQKVEQGLHIELEVRQRRRVTRNDLIFREALVGLRALGNCNLLQLGLLLLLLQFL